MDPGPACPLGRRFASPAIVPEFSHSHRQTAHGCRSGPPARAVFDDIRKTRQTDFVNNAWRAQANDPDALAQRWEKAKAVMAPGHLDALTKELVYLTVSIMNNCEYCIHSHTHFARRKGMTPAQYNELLQVIGLATDGNRMMTAMQVPVDAQFKVE